MKHCRRTVSYFAGVAAVMLLAVCCTLPKGGGGGDNGGGSDLPPLPDLPWKERLIDWSYAGVWANGVKGIPDRTTVFCDVTQSIPGSALLAKGDNVTDDSAALQAAIDLCPAGQVVFIPAGTYRVSATLHIGKGITVRGAGPDRTKIVQYANENLILVSGSSSSSSSIAVTSGFGKGSDTITVQDASPFKAGDMVLIDELNDPRLVTAEGVGGTCTWCGRDGLRGTRAMGECLLVKAKSGNTLTLHRPLYFDYQAELQPLLTRKSSQPLINAGIEDIHLACAPGNTSGLIVRMSNCAYCWLKGVESSEAATRHIEMFYYAIGNEFRDCYFHDSQSFESNHGRAIGSVGFIGDNLIENNMFTRCHVAVEFEAGASGNVVAYNYSHEMQHFDPSWMIWHLSTHGAHTYMNLWEGNIAGQISFDDYWGSGSHQMVFRNHIRAQDPNQPISSNIVACIVEAKNYYDTFIANVLGMPGMGGSIEENPYTTSYRNPVIWKVGYNCCSETGAPRDPQTAATLFRTGNWEYPGNAVRWANDERDFPDSLYLTEKPAWFGSLAWPPFAPDRAGFDPNNLNKIPAQVAFENGPGAGYPFTPFRNY